MLSIVIAKIQANISGMDADIMLDDRGFVAELNDTNLFMIKNNEIIDFKTEQLIHNYILVFLLF